MAEPISTTTYILLALAAAGTGASIYQGQEAAGAQKKQIAAQLRAQKAQEKAAQAKSRMDAVRARRERMSAVREARIKRAQVVQQAESQGISGSTTAEGAVRSVDVQAASNMGFLDSLQSEAIQGTRALAESSEFERQAMGFRAEAIGAQQTAAVGGAVAQLGMAGLQHSDQISSVFERADETTRIAQETLSNSPVGQYYHI